MRKLKTKLPVLLLLLLVASCVSKEQPLVPPGPDPEKELVPAEGATVYGLVLCNGKGVGNVSVSDGYEIVRTDKDGRYDLRSAKKNAQVYISIPSGYTVASVGVVPQFFKKLHKIASLPERVDFELFDDGDQTKHTMLFFGDIHLTGRDTFKDRQQFRTFTTEINDYLKICGDAKVYAMTLGDMTWDYYWYSCNYCFPEYLADVNAIKGLQIFHTIGNHDHNMRTAVDGNLSGWDMVDWDTAARFRTDVCPNYYSFNIGKVHYIVVDDIYCINTTGGKSADRIYQQKVSDDNLKWIRKDLSYVPKSTPVVVTMHATLHNYAGYNDLRNAADFKKCFDGYSYVRVVTGHTHKVWNVDSGNIHEHNSGSVCACWWGAGSYYPTLNLAQDGSPGGYRVMDWDGTAEHSYFKGVGRPAGFQFRAYDRNEIAMKAVDYGVSKYASEFDAYMTRYGKYNVKNAQDSVLINVWDYDSRWKVEASEDNVHFTSCKKIRRFDPLFLATYSAMQLRSSSSPSFTPYNTAHMFSYKASSHNSTVYIRVTDDEGRVYTEPMQRPKQFVIDKYK